VKVGSESMLNILTESETSWSDCPKKEVLADQLKDWALQQNISHAAVDSLLTILRATEIGNELPKTARTLLSTLPSACTVSEVSGMEYVYIGIRKHLLNLAGELDNVDSFKLAFNVDGLPLFKSTSISAWLILGLVTNIPDSPVFPVCVTIGTTKPTNLEFLVETIEETKQLMQHGLCVSSGKTIDIDVSHFVCDAPAKSLIKATKLYSGYHACFDCTIEGDYMHRRMTYQQVVELIPRTDFTFRHQICSEHHTGESPLCDLQINMVNQFPIDYLHSCLLGVMKKLLNCWVSGTKNPHRLTHLQVDEVDNRLKRLRKQTPNNFNRKPRHTKELARWKGTEFRTFLLYTGKSVLKRILSSEKYEHFLNFSVALLILLNSKLTSEYLDYAQDLLEQFVENCKKLYGQHFLSYNVHSLLHLTKHAKQFGSLENCSAFKFENYMQTIKKFLRQGNRPMAQIIKRISERQNQALLPVKSTLEKLKVSTKPPNNVYMTRTQNLIELVKVSSSSEETPDKKNKKYICRKFLSVQPFFKVPCNSKLVHIYHVENAATCLDTILDADLLVKCYKMSSTKDKSIIQALIWED